jgi:hypothetical protein
MAARRSRVKYESARISMAAAAAWRRAASAASVTEQHGKAAHDANGALARASDNRRR